jgi:hypothetical protein
MLSFIVYIRYAMSIKSKIQIQSNLISILNNYFHLLCVCACVYIYRVIHEVFPPLSEVIPEVIWNEKCEYTNGMQLIIKEIQ